VELTRFDAETLENCVEEVDWDVYEGGLWKAEQRLKNIEGTK